MSFDIHRRYCWTLLVFILCFQARADYLPGIPFHEGFEKYGRKNADGTPARPSRPWTVVCPPTSRAISIHVYADSHEPPALEGKKALVLEAGTGDTAALSVTQAHPSGTLRFHCAVYWEPGSDKPASIQLRAPQSIVRISSDKDRHVMLQTTEKETALDELWKATAWNQLDIDCDFNQAMFTVRVNDKQIAEGKLPAAGSIERLHWVFTPAFHGTGKCYIDEVTVTNPTLAGSTNLAPGAAVHARSWLEDMRPSYLNDGDAKYRFRSYGWRSGTRLNIADDPSPEPITFDFHNSRPASIHAVDVIPATGCELGYFIEAYDGKTWRRVTDNITSKQQAQWPQPVDAYSLRVNIISEVQQDRLKLQGLFRVAEIQIWGKLSGEDLAKNLAVTFGPESDRVTDENQNLNLSIHVAGLPATATCDGELELRRRYTDAVIKHVEFPKWTEGEQKIDLGVLAAGAYEATLTLRDHATSAVIARASTLVGVRSQQWLNVQVDPFTENIKQYAASNDKDQKQHWDLAADINGLDSPHQLPNLAYYLDQCRANHIIAECFIPWAAIEPLPGVYDFTFSDYILRQASQRGVHVRLTGNGFVGGNLPAWMASHIAVAHLPDGKTADSIEPSIFDPVIREHGRRLTMLLMKRYGRHPAVGMWTLNTYGEFPWFIRGGRYTDVSEPAMRAFHQYLTDKYKMIDELNKAWNTSYTAFDDVAPPQTGFSVPWADYCQFMFQGLADYYQPIAELARQELPANVELGITGGYITGGPFFDMIKRYNIRLSCEGMENPQWINWARILQSQGLTPYGEPGYVNIRKLNVNRSLFLAAVSGMHTFTYRQYGWPNDEAWPQFAAFRNIGDRLLGAAPMKIPLVFAGTLESGLGLCSDSFAIGGVWTPAGALQDALLKLGTTCDFYDGHNPQVLADAAAGVVVDLGTSAWNRQSIADVEKYVADGGRLMLMPIYAHRDARMIWGTTDDSNEGDALLTAVGGKGLAVQTQEAKPTALSIDDATNAFKTLTGMTFHQTRRITPMDGDQAVVYNADKQPVVVRWSHQRGTVYCSGVEPDWKQTYGNRRGGPGGTGWNIHYGGDDAVAWVWSLLQLCGRNLPYRLHSDLSDTWACGFARQDERLILIYNNDESHPAAVEIDQWLKSFFPADQYQVTARTNRQVIAEQTLDRANGSVRIEVPPYEMVLVEMRPM